MPKVNLVTAARRAHARGTARSGPKHTDTIWRAITILRDRKHFSWNDVAEWLTKHKIHGFHAKTLSTQATRRRAAGKVAPRGRGSK